jgi:hypothetical protein
MVTLITGPQGSGKTLLVESLTGNKRIHIYDQYMEENIFGRILMLRKESERIIFDGVINNNQLLFLIKRCKESQLDLVLISNVPETEFKGFEIDRIFTVKLKK